MFWVTASSPWGILGIGKRPWTFGTGLQYDGEDAASTESISLVAPYGPLDIGIAFYPYRFAGSSSIEAYGAQDDDLYSGDSPYQMNHTPKRQYFSRADKSGTFSKDFLAFLVYHSGPMRAGILGSYGSYHIGPEAQLYSANDNPENQVAIVPQDTELFHGSGFVKFNNGRFFFNAEAAWLYWTDRWSGVPNTGSVVAGQGYPNPDDGYPNPRYIEQWRYMVEMGVFSGPAKLSLLYAWTPGSDRRGRGDGTLTLIGKQPAAFVWHAKYDRQMGNFDVFRPYSYLFSYDYGAGLNAYNFSGDGYLRDASALAARLDYTGRGQPQCVRELLLRESDLERVQLGVHRPERRCDGRTFLSSHGRECGRESESVSYVPQYSGHSPRIRSGRGIRLEAARSLGSRHSRGLLATGQMVQLRVYRPIGRGMA